MAVALGCGKLDTNFITVLAHLYVNRVSQVLKVSSTYLAAPCAARDQLVVHRMPVYVSVASSYCKVGKLAGTQRKHTEGAGK